MWICPVCNGFDVLNHTCPRCGRLLDDMGRLSDYYNPYSPYREIDHIKLTNGFIDQMLHRCIHLLHCPHCDCQLHQAVQEQLYPTNPF
jgi:hypothetical protein